MRRSYQIIAFIAFVLLFFGWKAGADRTQRISVHLIKPGQSSTLNTEAETVRELIDSQRFAGHFSKHELIHPGYEADLRSGMNLFFTVDSSSDPSHDKQANAQISRSKHRLKPEIIETRALPEGRRLPIQGVASDPVSGATSDREAKLLTPSADRKLVLEGQTRRKNRQLHQLLEKGSMRLVATGYSPHRLDTYPYNDGNSALGLSAGYGLVAVDPRVIPLGTRLYVEGYGYAIAADVGGDIKGKRIDLGFHNRSNALHFGRRTVKVHILG